MNLAAQGVNRVRISILVVVIGIFWGLAALSRKPFIPSSVDDGLFFSYPFLKAFSFGHEKAMGHLLWLNTTLDFAAVRLRHQEYPNLFSNIHTIVKLDPTLEYAYEFAGLAAEGKAELKQSLLILEKGMERFPLNYKLRLYAAMNRLTLDSSYLAAAQYLKPLIIDNQLPFYLRSLASTFMKRGGHHRGAVYLLVDQYLSSPSELSREMVIRKLEAIGGKIQRTREIRGILVEMKKEPKTRVKQMESLIHLLELPPTN